MTYRTFETCPRGNKTCLKMCYGEQCLDCKYERKECCGRYCIFNANSLVTKVQTGEIDANKAIEAILKS